jgi:uncharacterized protein (TIGR01777 family)
VRILIAGGSGLLGRRLSAAWLASGAEVTVLSRRPDRGRRPLPPGVDVRHWAPPGVDDELVDTIRGAKAVINLAGESLAGPPWTAGRKRALLESRLAATGALVGAIGRLPAADRPEVLVNASGIDVYGDRRDGECGEDAPAGDTVLARIVVAWEAAARQAEKSGVRVVLARTALVIAPEALAFRLLTLPVRLFVGGPLGSGEQPFTWIHVDDAVRLYRLAVADGAIRGPLNLVALETPAQRQVARTIGRVLHRPSGFPTPEFLLRLVLRDAADLVLHGRRAVPARAIAAGYRFRFPKLEPAVRDALGRPAG